MPELSGEREGDPVVEHSRAFYDSIAERFATWSESSPYNAYYERPALRALLGEVNGLRVLDAGCAAGSHSDREMFGRGSYFDIELAEAPWRAIGAEMLSRFYRFPLQAMTDPLFDAGFLIERLVEPRPLPEMAGRDQEEFQLLARRPAFLLLRCVRR